MLNLVLNILLVIFFVYLFNRIDNKYQITNNLKNSIDYETMFDNVKVPMLLLNDENKIIKSNESFRKKFDFSKRELEGKKISSLVNLKEPENKTKYILDKINSGEKYSGKSKVYDKEGNVIDIEINLHPIYRAEKLLAKHIIINKIDDEEKKISSMLRESRRKIRDLHQTALKMQNVRSEQEVYDLTIKAAENILDFDLCTLDIVEDSNLVVKATSSNIFKGESISAPLDTDSLATHVYKKQQSLLSPDIQNEEIARPTSDKYHAALTIPIGERGIFQAVSTKINEFTREDLELVELLIAHALSALQRLEMDQKIRFLGFHDNLTGLYNRHFLNEEIKRLDTQRQTPISVIIGDLNGLKLINDIFGHEEGDKFLKKAAEVLQKCLREEDILGRWGGDEFMIILPQTNSEEVSDILARIKKELANTFQGERPISISLGYATKDANFEDSFNKLVEKADYMMYKNKAAMYKEDDNPLMKMIKKKVNNDELNKGEFDRLDSLLNVFKKAP